MNIDVIQFNKSANVKPNRDTFFFLFFSLLFFPNMGETCAYVSRREREGGSEREKGAERTRHTHTDVWIGEKKVALILAPGLRTYTARQSKATPLFTIHWGCFF